MLAEQCTRLGLGHRASTLGCTVVCVVAAATLYAASSGSASTTYPGRNGKIAVTGYRDNQAALDVVRPGREPRKVLQGGRDEAFTDPSWSPDGTRVALCYCFGGATSRIRIADVVTGKAREISTGRLEIQSPAFFTHRRIVFAAKMRRTRHLHTYTVRRDGTGLHKLFDAPVSAVSANNRWFLSGEGSSPVRVLNSAGRKVRTLLERRPAYQYHDPSFSPNGRWIAFHRSRKTRSDVFVIRRDGTHMRRLTWNGISTFPVFSPDGRWIAFVRGTNVGGNTIVALSVKHPGKRKVLARVPGAQYWWMAWGRRPRRQSPPATGLGRRR